MLTPWKKSYDQPRQYIKKQRHYFVSKGLFSQGIVFPVVMYGCESWTVKKAECQGIDAFELWCWRRLLRVPWTARRSNQFILKEINPECSLEGLMLKLIYCFAFTVMLAEMKKLSNVSKWISFSGIPQLRKWQGLDFTQFCKVKHNLFKFAKEKVYY